MSKHSRGSSRKDVNARFKIKGEHIEIKLYKKRLTEEVYEYLTAHNFWMQTQDERKRISKLFTGKTMQTTIYKCHLPLSDWLEVKRLSVYGYNLQSNLVKVLLPVLEPITEPDCLQDVAIEVAWLLIKVIEKEDGE